jgi:hypothetical protein
MNKRGLESTMVTIALLVVFALLALVVTGRFVYFVLFQSAESICEQSIVQSGLAGVPDFKCTANYDTLKKDDLSAKGNLDDAVKRELSDRMYLCWKKTGKGLIDPYWNSYEIKTLLVGSAVTNVYLICDIIDFKDIPKFGGLLYWEAMNKPNQGKTTYYDYIYNRRPTAEELRGFELGEDMYNTSQRYAIAWKYSRSGGEKNNSVVLVPYTELAGTSTELFSTAYFNIVMN